MAHGHGHGHHGGGHNGGGHRPHQLGQGLLGKMPGALKPTGRRQIRNRAVKEMRAVYKSGFVDLRGQEGRINAVAAKRAEDNHKYLNWLSTQTEQLRAHAAAADSELQTQQQGIQQSAQQSFIDLRNQLVSQGGHEGGVTNPNQAATFDVTPEAQRATDQVANARQSTAAAVNSGKKMANIAASSNFALMAASSAKNQADQYNALKDVASARQKLILERAAKTAEEVARMLDQEITKATSRMAIRQQAGQLALGLKEHKLGKQQLALDRKIQTGQLQETGRHNRASEATAQQNADSSRFSAHHPGRGSSSSGHKGHKAARKKQKHKIKAVTRRYLSGLSHADKRAIRNNPQKRRQAISILSDRASHVPGIDNENLTNKMVRRLVLQWAKGKHHHHHSGGTTHHPPA